MTAENGEQNVVNVILYRMVRQMAIIQVPSMDEANQKIEAALHCIENSFSEVGELEDAVDAGLVWDTEPDSDENYEVVQEGFEQP
jgi:hypothetical protein